MPETLRTPLGEFKGIRKDGVKQFRGIKFGLLADQLTAPEVFDGYGGGVVDATEWGVVAIDMCQYEQSVLIQKVIEGTPAAPPMSGLDCLNLNITVPDIQETGDLPVLVFIHGGGYIMGANWWPQYDPVRVVKLSMEVGLPVIAVNINYRLGILGNLTSKELRKAGYPGNNSLRDQKCALLWIKKHIANFGGDPDNVTVFGESAGGASVLSLLFSQEPLFKRGISMSGTPIMMQPLTEEQTEESYQQVINVLGLGNTTVQDQIKRLTTITPEELTAASPLSIMTIRLRPHLDRDIVPDTPTFKSLEDGSHHIAGREWCTDLILGDCQHDGNVFHFMGFGDRKAGIAAQFYASLTKNLPFSAEAVLKAYNMEPSTDDETAWKTLIDFATDIAYVAPSITYARYGPGKTYYYNFNEPNPWEGKFKGWSTHGLDIIYFFQAYNDSLTPEARKVAEGIATNFIEFAHGKPWAKYDGEYDSVKKYGPSISGIDSKQERRNVLFQLKEEGKVDLDELISVFLKFLGGQ